MNNHKFLTVKSEGEGFYKEKGSKFLGFAIPCKSEEAAKEQLNKLWKAHPQACHVCYAFRFGSDKKRFRASDDGEPSNSAGPPILGQIQSFDVTNTLIAVVRYYGGTNLGVGGLITAYRTAAKEALENAEIIEDEDQFIVELQFGYAEMPKVMSVIKSFQLKIIEQQLELECRIVCEIAASDSEGLNRVRQLENVTITEHGIKE